MIVLDYYLIRVVKCGQYDASGNLAGDWFPLQIRLPYWLGKLYWRYLAWKWRLRLGDAA